MAIYIILFVLLFALHCAFGNNKIAFCISAGVLLYALISLRSITLGVYDTSGIYLQNFNYVQSTSWNNIWTYKLPSQIAFLAITKFISLFSNNYQVYLAIIAIPIVVAVCNLIYKYSDEPLISFISYISLYWLYSFFLLRQMLALSIIAYSVKYIYRRKPIQFVALVLVASAIHNTAIIFLIAYPFCRFVKFGYQNYFFILASFILTKLAPSIVTNYIGKYFPVQSSYISHGIYNASGDFSAFGLVPPLAILVLAHIFKRNQSVKDDILFNLSTLSMVTYCFAFAVSDLYRLSIYFGLFNIILISKVFKKVNKAEPTDSVDFNNDEILLFIYVVLIIALIAYFLLRSVDNMNAMPYLFFWQN